MRIVHRAGLFLLAAACVLATPALGAGAGKNFEATPQARAYRALLKTVAAGDFEGYKKCMTKESSKGIDQQMKDMGMDSKKGMDILKAMTPTDLKFTSLKVDGKKATLEATGKVMGEANKGTIAMEQEDGQWRVANQSWTNAK